MLGKLIPPVASGLLVLGTAQAQPVQPDTLTDEISVERALSDAHLSRFPAAAWEVAPLPADAADTVNTLIADAMARELSDEMGETRAIVIIHKGQLVAEAYREGFGPETKQVSWSMAKSVTHALVGRALQLGIIDSIDAPMPSPWEEDDPRAAITWRQWLNMTDGLDYKEINSEGLADNDVVQMMFGPGRFDVIDYAQNLPQIHGAGTHWNYSTAGLHMVARALQTELDIRTWCATNAVLGDASISPVTPCSPSDVPMAKWMENTLFAPLGMDAVTEFDAAGTFLGGSLVWASARDFARFGYLYLRDGVWGGERLLPEGWVDFARAETPAENANVYGAGWWITPPEGVTRSHPNQAAATCPCDAYSAQGHEGQTIWVAPSKDLVIVRLGLMSNGGNNWPALQEWNQAVARAFRDME